MKSCPFCAYSNKEGLLFCEDCGRRLASGDAAMTMPTKTIVIPVTEDFPVHSTWGTARFEANSQIVMHIRDSTETVTLIPNKRTILGRNDGNNPQRPDLDLTPFGALEMGVSRVHAAIYRNEDTDTLTIVDMGSANGTHLNGQRLTPEQPRVLRDGDEIRFGKLITHIYFKT
jgi:hypothetical protein